MPTVSRAAYCARALCLIALFGLIIPTAAHAAFTSKEQKCVATFNKSFRKVVKTVGKDYCGCIKDRSKSTNDDDKLAGLTVSECFDADRKGKVAGATLKAGDKITAACTGNNPGVGITDVATLAAEAIKKEKAIFATMFGDVDTGVFRSVDTGKDPSKCQLSIAKAMKKCQDTKVNSFLKCKKDAMKTGKVPFIGGATSVDDLASCINRAWVVDEKQKVAKKCNLDALGKVDGIRKTITKKCVDKDVDLSNTFPACDTDDGEELHACIEAQLECATCRAIQATDGLGAANLGSLNCDLIDNGTLDDSCGLLSAETIDIASTAEPAESPGTFGVVVTDLNLIAQFGGAGFSLNNARYTRWRALDGPDTPDAILVLVAGFGGGANNFKILAENLIPRVLADHGLEIEVWGFHRRTNQLEDRAGALIAQNLNDAQIALDWYYGDHLGLVLDPALVAGPNRRAYIYNTSSDIPFIANYTGQTHSIDIDAVIEEATSVVNNDNVFLGGHSAGTGFTARYAATDFDLTGGGPVDAGYAKLRGLVMLEGSAGSTGGTVSTDTLDRIEAKFDGGLFAAVRDNAGRCVDGTTACTVLTEAAACVAQVPPKCTPPETAYGAVFGLSPDVTAASEPGALQGATDADTGLAILQVDQGGADTSAFDLVPELSLLALLFNPDTNPQTASGLVGGFLDDDGVGALLSPAIATSMGAPAGAGSPRKWDDISEGPFDPGIVPDNGAAPTTLPGAVWGQEKEVVRIDRYATTFLHAGSNAADWYFGTAGLNLTSAGTCDAGGTGLCIGGDVGAACADDGDCRQSIGLDSTALSVTRGRRDIVNLTQAGNIDIPVISFGGSNGLIPVPGRMTAFGDSIATCAAPSCIGTARVVDPNAPNPAFPTFGDVDGGFEVFISEGFAHQDVTVAEDGPDNNVLSPLSDFIARNTIP